MPLADGMLRLATGVPMAPMSSLGVGGAARWFWRATTVDDVASARRWCGDAGVPLCVLGGGTNMIVADGGVDALVLQVAIRGVDFSRQGASTLLRLGAGEPWDDAVAAAVSRGLAGVECLSGIPGSAGGTPVQNVGAYGQEVAQAIREVTALDRASGEVVTLRGTECGFGYRTSRFKVEDEGRFVICGIALDLVAGPPTVAYPDVIGHLSRRGIDEPGVVDVRNAVLAIRRQKGMVIDPADPDTRSVGSFFVNPVVDSARHADLESRATGRVPGFVLSDGHVKIPAAWLIEQSGFTRGYQAGAVGLSRKHPLAIVNLGSAASRDIVGLAGAIKRRVIDRFGIWLRAEPSFVGFGADPDVAFLKEARS